MDFGDVIHSYTRAQAIADGELVDVSATAREAGFKHHTAMTRAAWEDCVAWTDEDTKRTGVPQDESGRLWDVLWMARYQAAHPQVADADRVTFELVRVDRHASTTAPLLVKLVLHCGPGDAGEPVLTIMEPGED